MTDTPNTLIQQIFQDFTVDGRTVPVEFLRYEGKNNAYVTYTETDMDDTFSADDDLENFVSFYDFDIYSKYNYTNILSEVKSILRANGFRWQPARSSGDSYEADTGYYHKTLCFSIERSTTNG